MNSDPRLNWSFDSSIRYFGLSRYEFVMKQRKTGELKACFGSQYFRVLLNKIEPDAKQHLGHRGAIISNRAYIKSHNARLD